MREFRHTAGKKIVAEDGYRFDGFGAGVAVLGEGLHVRHNVDVSPGEVEWLSEPADDLLPPGETHRRRRHDEQRPLGTKRRGNGETLDGLAQPHVIG